MQRQRKQVCVGGCFFMEEGDPSSWLMSEGTKWCKGMVIHIYLKFEALCFW